jgi:hypothetical protein
MRVEWDEEKRLANLEKHGLDFADAKLVFSGPTYEVADDREDYGEPRMFALGILKGQVVAMVYTPREIDLYRIISLRLATKKEVRFFYGTVFN